MHHRESYHPVIGAPYINAIYVLLTWDEIRAGWRIVEKERCHPRPNLQGLIAPLPTKFIRTNQQSEGVSFGLQYSVAGISRNFPLHM